MKSFFASVECAERRLNPMKTNLVVADVSRGRGGICLAVSPAMKSAGVKNRCRLFEIPTFLDYMIVRPKMKKYIKYSADIYDIYLKYVSEEDIYVYSIDEVFIDATDYLKCYNLTAEEFAKKLINEIKKEKKIPATAGIGTNMYLAKIALDITAKKSPSGIGYLDEELFIKTLSYHRPITDFWGISFGTERRLSKIGVHDMAGIQNADKTLLKKIFGIDYEILYEHSFGRENCTIYDIKHYKKKTTSISNSQILFENYTFEKARIVLSEMVLSLCQDMLKKNAVANNISIMVGYAERELPMSKGSVAIPEKSNLFSVVNGKVLAVFDKIADRRHLIRRLAVSCNHLTSDNFTVFDFFSDVKSYDKERKAELAVIDIKRKFGKSSLVRCFDLLDGATAIIRNNLIGGHNGG